MMTVARASEAAAHVDARRIRERGARLHQACGRAAENALELGRCALLLTPSVSQAAPACAELTGTLSATAAATTSVR